MPDNDLFTQLSSAEQRIVGEVIARDWVSQIQMQQTAEAVLARRIDGPIHQALLQQRLISKDQCTRLEDFLHKDMEIGEYLVDRKIGAGAMGDVFLAHHTETNEAVALKLINKRYADDEQFIKRFEREIEALRGVEHPNIAGAAGYGTTSDGLPYMAMEYVAGPSLAQLLQQHGPLPEAYVLRIASEVAAGLDHIYTSTKLVHRDIKPENILTVPPDDAQGGDLFKRHDNAKLIDFGLARSYGNDDRLTMTGITMGTPHYMSPEQIRGSQEVDLRSDIYAIGATMFNLLTGRTPFQGASPGAVMTAHLTDPVPDPRKLVPSLSEPTRDVVMMCMAKESEQRYLNYLAFTNACKEALAAIGGHSSGMRLLRKPLVLKKPSAKSRPKDSQRKDAAVKEPPTSATVVSDTPEDPFAAVGHDSRNKDGTKARDKKVGTGPKTNRKTLDDNQPSDHHKIKESSDRIAREIHDAHGLGIMPMLVLGIAVVSLIAILAWRFLLS
ncbi:MAG: serine/threonine-protein kinase [Planctomycetota bacterium]|jgi:serine/threonine protein kinase|nr:serine/threonine-protein kinase [Planctomycetota bacterium]